MTSIKPPHGPSNLPVAPGSPTEGVGSAQPLGGSDAVSGVSASQAAAASDPIAALAADVQAGRIGMNDAVDRLLERAVAQLGGRLSVEERANLSDVLRTALESDPVLSSLR